MIDDIILIAEAGVDATILNSFINAMAAIRGLQFGVNKCKHLKITNTKEDDLNNVMEVDGWEQVREQGELKDKFVGKVKTEKVKSQKYLGLYIQDNGKNDDTIKNKNIKAIVTTRAVKNKIKQMRLGMYFFEAMKILRNSVFLSSYLYGTEVLYNMNEKDTKALMMKDEQFVKEVCSLERAVPAALIYLELGFKTVDVIVMVRRMCFLKYILERKSELAYEVYQKQKLNPLKGDWAHMVEKDKDELKLELTDKEIAAISKKEFKELLETKSNTLSFKKLIKRKSKLSKGKHLEYSSLKTQSYLMPESRLNLEEMKMMLRIRTDMTDLAEHMKYKHGGAKTCRVGCSAYENLEHLIECKIDTLDQNIVTKTDIENIKQGIINVETKSKLQMILKLIKRRNTMEFKSNTHDLSGSVQCGSQGGETGGK